MTPQEKKVYQKQYRIDHKEKSKNYNKNYYEKRKIESIEEIRLQNRENSKRYRINNKEKISNKARIYRKENIEKFRAKDKRNNLKKLNDSFFIFKEKIRMNIKNSFYKKYYPKKSKTAEILGCTFEEFKIYIESKFEPWMNWNNYGNKNGICTDKNQSWDLDHIIPISTAKTEEDVIKLNYYKNFQPLCSYVNRYIKSDKLT